MASHLDIEKDPQEGRLLYRVKGRLDTTTAPLLEKELKTDLPEVQELEFDFQDLEYLSSAGLRTLLSAQKIMNKQGSMKISHVNSTIMEIFEVTGFLDILQIV